MTSRVFGASIPLWAWLVAVLLSPAGAAAEREPEGFERVLPRGRIAAVDAPVYVGAAEAEIPADAWVLGFAIGDRAYAYSLNLLNAHEVVNDRSGEQAFAAVW